METKNFGSLIDEKIKENQENFDNVCKWKASYEENSIELAPEYFNIEEGKRDEFVSFLKELANLYY